MVFKTHKVFCAFLLSSLFLEAPLLATAQTDDLDAQADDGHIIDYLQKSLIRME